MPYSSARVTATWVGGFALTLTFDLLQERLGRAGNKEYLRILELAAKESEAQVDEALRVLLAEAEEDISAKVVAAKLAVDSHAGVRDVQVATIDLGLFDQLCEAREVLQ